MTPEQIIMAFLEQAGMNTRSTVLKSLAWLLVILVCSTITAFSYQLPEWMGVTFFVAAMASVILYLFTYTYCLFKDRDALRSEIYIIHKVAQGKGLLGDNLTGMFNPPDESTRLLEPGNMARIPKGLT